MKNFSVRELIMASLCLALGLILPSIFHMLGAPGTIFLPMHIPVLLCGLLCGYKYGAICGILTPIICSLFTGMPPMFPTAVVMMFELCAYGLFSGFLYKKFNIYISLISAMFIGRIVSGIANAIFFGVAGRAYGLSAFVSGAFITALPGIIVQLILIPILVIVVEKAGLLRTKENTI